MAKKFYSNFILGANSSVSPFLMKDESLMKLQGFNVGYRLGSLTKDPGYFRIGDKPSSEIITGIYDFQEDPSTQKAFRTESAGANLDLRYNNGGAWTSISGATTAWSGKADAATSFETFLGYMFVVGYDSANGYIPTRSLAGTTLGTTNLTNAPDAKFIVRYRDRLYMLNVSYGGTDYPFRVRVSPPVSAGALGDWDYTDNFFDLDYGLEITGVGVNWDAMVIFTKNSAYYYNQNQLKLLWRRGCASHSTIKNSGEFMVWVDRDGVWLSKSLSTPQNISGAVKDFILAANPNAMFGEVVNEIYHLYVGDVSVNGTSYSNLMLYFDFSTTTWAWRELEDDMSCMGSYDDSGSLRLYMGDKNGQTWDKSKYYDATVVWSDGKIGSAEGADITGIIETKPDPIDDPAIRKKLKSITTYSDRPGEMMVLARAYNNNVDAIMEYKPIGKATKIIHAFEGLDMEFNMLQMLVTETSILEYVSLWGIEIEYDIVGEETKDTK